MAKLKKTEVSKYKDEVKDTLTEKIDFYKRRQGISDAEIYTALHIGAATLTRRKREPESYRLEELLQLAFLFKVPLAKLFTPLNDN